MKNRRNYYRVLHVQPDAPAEVIRSSYRTMMQRMKMHPDLGGNHEVAALVNEAYAVLMNPAARARYDASVSAGVAAGSAVGSAAGQPGTDRHADVAESDAGSVAEGRCLFCTAARRASHIIEPDDVCARCGSALYPAIRHGYEVESQRAIERVSSHAPVEFWTHWTQSSSRRGLMEDLSLEGIQLRTETSLSEGQLVRLGSGVLDAVAVVANLLYIENAATHRWRVGLNFRTLRLHHQRGTFVSIDV